MGLQKNGLCDMLPMMIVAAIIGLFVMQKQNGGTAFFDSEEGIGSMGTGAFGNSDIGSGYDGESSYNFPRARGRYGYTANRKFSQTGIGQSVYREHPGRHNPPFTLRGGASKPMDINGLVSTADEAATASAASKSARPAPLSARPAPLSVPAPLSAPAPLSVPAPLSAPAPIEEVPAVLETVDAIIEQEPAPAYAPPPLEESQLTVNNIQPTPPPLQTQLSESSSEFPDFKTTAASALPAFASFVMHDPSEFGARPKFGQLIEGGAAWRGDGDQINGGRRNEGWGNLDQTRDDDIALGQGTGTGADSRVGALLAETAGGRQINGGRHDWGYANLDQTRDDDIALGQGTGTGASQGVNALLAETAGGAPGQYGTGDTYTEYSKEEEDYSEIGKKNFDSSGGRPPIAGGDGGIGVSAYAYDNEHTSDLDVTGGYTALGNQTAPRDSFGNITNRGDEYWDIEGRKPFSSRSAGPVREENVGAANRAAYGKWPRPRDNGRGHGPTIFAQERPPPNW